MPKGKRKSESEDEVQGSKRKKSKASPKSSRSTRKSIVSGAKTKEKSSASDEKPKRKGEGKNSKLRGKRKSESEDEVQGSKRKKSKASPKSSRSTRKSIVSAAKTKEKSSASDEKPKRKGEGKNSKLREEALQWNSKNKRQTILDKYVGAHTSITGGLENAVYEAVLMGGLAFGMFLKSQRQWASKPLQESDAIKFRNALQEFGFSPHMVVPHGSYLMNCGSAETEVLKKSRDMLVDELQRCQKLGLAIFNFHPGSTCGKISVEESIKRIAESINMAHAKTAKVITVIENMSCQGYTVGGRFEELHAIISHVKNKSRIGVCLDTCHTYAAGYDISTKKGYDQTMSEFDRLVGFKYLKALHVNDSMGDLGCHKDRHQNIGKGKLGLQTFKYFMNDKRFKNIPFILETPGGYYDKEIKCLYRLCGKT